MLNNIIKIFQILNQFTIKRIIDFLIRLQQKIQGLQNQDKIELQHQYDHKKEVIPSQNIILEKSINIQSNQESTLKVTIPWPRNYNEKIKAINQVCLEMQKQFNLLSLNKNQQSLFKKIQRRENLLGEEKQFRYYTPQDWIDIYISEQETVKQIAIGFILLNDLRLEITIKTTSIRTLKTIYERVIELGFPEKEFKKRNSMIKTFRELEESTIQKRIPRFPTKSLNIIREWMSSDQARERIKQYILSSILQEFNFLGQGFQNQDNIEEEKKNNYETQQVQDLKEDILSSQIIKDECQLYQKLLKQQTIPNKKNVHQIQQQKCEIISYQKLLKELKGDEENQQQQQLIQEAKYQINFFEDYEQQESNIQEFENLANYQYQKNNEKDAKKKYNYKQNIFDQIKNNLNLHNAQLKDEKYGDQLQIKQQQDEKIHYQQNLDLIQIDRQSKQKQLQMIQQTQQQMHFSANHQVNNHKAQKQYDANKEVISSQQYDKQQIEQKQNKAISYEQQKEDQDHHQQQQQQRIQKAPNQTQFSAHQDNKEDIPSQKIEEEYEVYIKKPLQQQAVSNNKSKYILSTQIQQIFNNNQKISQFNSFQEEKTVMNNAYLKQMLFSPDYKIQQIQGFQNQDKIEQQKKNKYEIQHQQDLEKEVIPSQNIRQKLEGDDQNIIENKKLSFLLSQEKMWAKLKENQVDFFNSNNTEEQMIQGFQNQDKIEEEKKNNYETQQAQDLKEDIISSQIIEEEYQWYEKPLKQQTIPNEKNVHQIQQQESEMISDQKLLEIIKREEKNQQQQQLIQESTDKMHFFEDYEQEESNIYEFQNLAYYKQQKKNLQEAQKKYFLVKELIPSRKIGIKLEESKEIQNKQLEQISQHKQFYENRKELFQKNQKLLSTLQESFFKNKNLYNSIWELRLKIQVDLISQKILKPIQVNLSEKEISIILINKNQLVIGRSGTGKTTTAVVKLTSMQMGYDNAQKSNPGSQSQENLRICFTTISNYLTLDVYNFFLRIMNKPQLLAFSKPNTLSQVQRWPHFTNIKELILQIDGNLAVPFIQRDIEGKIIQAQSMEINLENRLIVKLRDEIGKNQYSEIGVRQFIEEFWFSNKTKFDKLNVDPYIAYSQINSYITGNQISHKNENNMISEEKYLSLVGKSKLDLDEEQKMNIYFICSQYQKWKYEKKYFDLNDIINYIIKNILDGNYDSANGYFHYLFVDEVQDLNCACLYLLCLLTEQSVYLGGDTAQTISQENCFKFTDLKAIFSDNNRDSDYQANETLSSELVQTQLTQNFRSHGQIIELNNVIVKLLEIFFPTSLDHLIPEISLNKGPKPILLKKRENLYSFLSQDSEINENVDYFGRLQVYIVKDKEEKANLQKILQKDGKKGQIFTVLESKGLEFQDVIAYKLLSSSYNSTKCWNALNLLKISEEKISIKDFQFKYHCKVQENFEGSTFSREYGSDYVKMKVISKKENADASIKKEYSKDFSKLINELKNIYVAFSRARSRIFIYEEDIFVGKQIKNPIIKFLEDLNIIDNQELDEQLIEKIMKVHLDYIKDHEPVKNNKQQFISMAEILKERKQFLDAAEYYEKVGDELNKRICIGLEKIKKAQIEIENKKEQFEKEKKQMLQGQVEMKNLVFYQNIKKELIESIEYLKGSQEFELIAQIYFTLGMYNEAVQNFKYFKNLLLSSPNSNQDISKIKEVNSNIKQIYFLKANLLEVYIKNEKDLEQNYKELENFIEKDGIQDIKVQLYLSFRLNDYEKLFNNLVKFKENNLIEKEDLIHILHYYYPKILELKLEQIMQINTNQNNKKTSKTELGKVLIDLIQQVIIPFQEEFVRIAKSRQNMEFFQEQQKFFNQLSNIYELKTLDQDRQFMNGYYLMLFYIILIQFDCLEQQKKFNVILEQQELSHQIFIDQILQKKNDKKVIQNLFNEMKYLSWLLSGKVQKQISIGYQYYYAYLGLYDELKSRNLVASLQDNHQYLNFTFQLKSFDEHSKFDYFYDQMYYIQKLIAKAQLDQTNIKRYEIPQYKQIQNFLTKLNQSQFDLEYLKDALKNIFQIIDSKQIIQDSKIKKFIKCQDIFLSFFLCLQELNINYMSLLDNKFIIKFTELTKYFFNFNYELFESTLYGEYNGIFQDSFCSCFGFISPHLPGQDIFDENFKHIWQLLGCYDYYLVNLDNPYLDEKIVEKKRLISPILSPSFSKIKIIEKKTAVMLSKRQFGLLCTDFLQIYSKYLITQTKESYYYQLNPMIKISYPFQILYLNDCLQQLIKKIDQQICILEQNIPKKHTREHELLSIKNLIDQIEKSDQLNQNEQKLQNLKRIYDQKLKSQMRDKQKKQKNINQIRLLNDRQIYQYKSNIIQSGLVISQFLYSQNIQMERDEMQQYLLDEASNVLAQIINKIEQQGCQKEVEESYKKLRIQLNEQQVKYKEQYDQVFEIAKNQKKENNQPKKEENIFSRSQVSDFIEPINTLQCQQSKEQEQGIFQDEEGKEEDIQNDAENILQSCDDILYAFTILNMCNQRSVLRDIFYSYQDNQINQFTQMCYKFFEARNIFDRINIGLLSNQLLLIFRQNINQKTQINIFQIGLAEIYLLLNTLEVQDKTIKVCIPYGFENCFSFDSNFNQPNLPNQPNLHQIKVKTYSTDIDYRLIYQYINDVLDLVDIFSLKNHFQVPIFNMILQILILFLKKQTEIICQKEFVKKIFTFLDYFSKNIAFLKFNKRSPFRNAHEYSDLSEQAYYEQDDEQKNNLYKQFRAKFHKTFLYLAEQATNSLNKNDSNYRIEYDLINFIQSIRYNEIQFILISIKDTQNMHCVLQIQKLDIQYEIKDVKVIEEHDKIKSQIQKIKNDLSQNNIDDLNEQQLINIFYKQDFTMFISQIIYYNKPIQSLFNEQIQQNLQLFEQKFLKATIQIQKVRKIFLQELSSQNFRSSEKYIYIIQKLKSIFNEEKEFYRHMIQTEEIIDKSEEFEQKLEEYSIKYMNQMDNIYSDYLHYISEPFEKIVKESLDIQKFIQEQINSIN
ncbi:hypothetical protein ABPG72_019456 [Tetrahymena utriculariae]